MTILRRLAGGIYFMSQIVGSFALIGLMFVVGGTVIYRWFGGTFQGSYEVAETFTIVTITMAIFMATVNRSHVDVRLIHDRFPPAIRRALMVIMGLIATVFWCGVTWSVFLLTRRLARTGELTDVLQIDIVPFRWITVVGCAAVTLVLAWQTFRWLAGDKEETGGGHSVEKGTGNDT